MRAEEGNLAYIREFVDRLDGKAVQVVDRRDVPIEELSDAELYRIAAGGGLNPDMMLLPPPVKSGRTSRVENSNVQAA